MKEINKFDFLITNSIDYDIKKNIDFNDEIHYYATAIKKVDNQYITINHSLNNKAIKIMNLAISLKIEIIENPPLARALYMEVEETEDAPNHLTPALDKIYQNL